ncbi:hypothetical protein NE604_00920 [Anaerofustis stercorihominis]|uniref:Uncharacterized protein n=1 Tax=Anaerofustis stercorihominis DSM 17244 TaxID=445971 RepID=B1C721_9FIRM|nr:hypothetical protein [Anaerofustis stercorihominis]EDS72808.1 hypothetical protein ANASTE_00518 [Anaerofustis stercorihominis DSM 17244]MCQ4794205.1 hypothetical protein [Anaerofustis stercorihominis]
MKIIKSLLIWILIFIFAFLNGGLREFLLIPYFGEKVGLILSGAILILTIMIISFIFIPGLKLKSGKEAFIIGFIWFLLTNLFDLFSIYSSGGNFMDFVSLFNITTGNLWTVVVITTLLAPISIYKIKTN